MRCIRTLSFCVYHEAPGAPASSSEHNSQRRAFALSDMIQLSHRSLADSIIRQKLKTAELPRRSKEQSAMPASASNGQAHHRSDRMRGTPFAHFSSPMALDSWSTCDCLQITGDVSVGCVCSKSEWSRRGAGTLRTCRRIVALQYVQQITWCGINTKI